MSILKSELLKILFCLNIIPFSPDFPTNQLKCLGDSLAQLGTASNHLIMAWAHHTEKAAGIIDT